jgi:hypothetical protein
MATAVGVMDEPKLTADTDVLVVVNAEARRLQWVPRDLWCEQLGDRVKRAFSQGGHGGLVEALGEHGFRIGASVCVGRGAVERALEGTRVGVPVSERLEFWYPLLAGRPIEEGRKRISFEPPVETLEGERIHQWMGARYQVTGPGSDFKRILRQQVLFRSLLEQDFDFARVLADGDEVAISGPALDELCRVDASFAIATFASDAVPTRIDGKEVLVRGAHDA